VLQSFSLGNVYDCVAGFKIIRQLNHLDLQISLNFNLFCLQLFEDAACENHSTVIAHLELKQRSQYITSGQGISKPNQDGPGLFTCECGTLPATGPIVIV
jgi:hypothetical protein